mmetsp:Transcript_48011/g.114104  ORF Transcript_48011/g.114104 Transcript_48011/m.114104 type:complete len:332 (-) Transcript_48011:150-1145(-)|eukprot:CAMPEP_0178424222 /NCGR_PEP_ID=MMETSP0689_2-20121128/28098_1 /TAXON_ID=160604 /ORGANISM="Amphidinium massartii, Strain CS-259" /LENGTH=331 /DNA_ID=CAMNT_0020045851 /DNA_START=79 /DNA_END=1077 /DNA_ORIENTATION=-
MSNRDGRFYEAEFPEVDDIVVVQVKRIVDMGAYVSLLEYDNREGMMLLSELSKRRIRSVSKLLKVGRQEVCMVLRADHEKGYIDLSKRRVDKEAGEAKEEQFAKAKAVHGIMRHVANTNGIPVDELCKKVSWPLYKNKREAYDAFRKHVDGEINVWDEVDFSQPGEDLSDKAEKLKADIELGLSRRLIQQMLRLRARVEVSCNEYEGIDAVKSALLKGLECTGELEVKIKLIAHPVFDISCMCKDTQLGISTLSKCMEVIEEEIKKHGGDFVVKTKPEVVGQKDDEKDAEEDEDDDDDSESEVSHMGDLDADQLKELEAKAVEEDDEEDGK